MSPSIIFSKKDGSKIRVKKSEVRLITKELVDEEGNFYIRIAYSTYGDVFSTHAKPTDGSGRVYGNRPIITIYWDPNTDRFYKHEYKKNEIHDQDDYFIRIFRDTGLHGGIRLGYTMKIGFSRKGECVRKVMTWIILTKVGEKDDKEIWMNGKYVQYLIYSQHYRQWFTTEKFQVDDGNVKWDKGEKERLIFHLRKLGLSPREISKTLLHKDEPYKIKDELDEGGFDYYPSPNIIKKTHRKYLINQGIISQKEAIEMDGFFEAASGKKYYV